MLPGGLGAGVQLADPRCWTSAWSGSGESPHPPIAEIMAAHVSAPARRRKGAAASPPANSRAARIRSCSPSSTRPAPSPGHPVRRALAAGSAVDLLADNVSVPGMAGRLRGHVGQQPAQGKPLSVHQPSQVRPRITGCEDGGVTLGDGRAVVAEHFLRAAFRGHFHAGPGALVVLDAGEMLAEPVALCKSEVLD